MNTLYSLLAGGATVLTLSGYVANSLKYWWVGAALLPKLGFCGQDCAGFGMCAAWDGFTFGLVVSM